MEAENAFSRTDSKRDGKGGGFRVRIYGTRSTDLANNLMQKLAQWLQNRLFSNPQAKDGFSRS